MEEAKEAYKEARASNSAESYNVAAQSAYEKAIQNGANEAQAKKIADAVRETFRESATWSHPWTDKPFGSQGN